MKKQPTCFLNNTPVWISVGILMFKEKRLKYFNQVNMKKMIMSMGLGYQGRVTDIHIKNVCECKKYRTASGEKG